jgi:hypothetical protein
LANAAHGFSEKPANKHEHHELDKEYRLGVAARGLLSHRVARAGHEKRGRPE